MKRQPTVITYAEYVKLPRVNGRFTLSAQCDNYIGRRINYERLLKGMTQHELARLTGLTQSNISQWEMGKYLPRVHNLLQVCAVLGLELRLVPITPS